LITACIVTYHNDHEELKKTISSFLNTDMNVKLYICDNSSNRDIEALCSDDRVEYIYNNANDGFGAGHNIAIKKAIVDGSKYHIVLNPDIYFNPGVLEKISAYMDKELDVGLVMPKVIYPNGEIQYLCKLIPTPMDLFGRRFLPKFLTKRRNNKYELRFTGYNKIMEVPYLSGCFMFLRVSAIKEVGLFDESFFMYMEDVDFSRRINEKYKTVYFPEVTIVHNHAKESYKNFKMFKMHILSAIKYFNKWGWLNDEKRKIQNMKILNKLGKE